jgi:hypothetical protein
MGNKIKQARQIQAGMTGIAREFKADCSKV